MDRFAMHFAHVIVLAMLAMVGCRSSEERRFDDRLARRATAARAAVEDMTGVQIGDGIRIESSTSEYEAQRRRAGLSEAEIAALRARYAALATIGLVGSTYDPATAGAIQAKHFLEGYYESGQSRLVVLRDTVARLAQGQGPDPVSGHSHLDAVLVHEFVHAAQDLRGSMHVYEGAQSSDALLAARAIVEGEATMWEWRYADGAAYSRFKSIRFVDNSEATVGTDYYDSRTAWFPYSLGAQFVDAVFLARGRRGVEELFHHPPRSTTQILHPEKYLAPQPEQTANMEDLNSALQFIEPHASLMQQDCLGEYAVRVLFEKHHMGPSATTAAAGWAGDRWVSFQSGSRLGVLWVTAWDTAVDASEFASGLRRVLGAIYPGRRLARQEIGVEVWTVGDEDTAIVRCERRTVFHRSAGRPLDEAAMRALKVVAKC